MMMTKRRTRKPKLERITSRPGFVREVRLGWKWARVPEWLDATKPVISSKDAWPYFLPLERRVRETVMALYLRGSMPIAREVVHVGTMTRCDLCPGEILRSALHLAATVVIVAHNHPSMSAQPSLEDAHAFENLKKAAALLGITVHDSLIIVPGAYVSLSDQKHLHTLAGWHSEGEKRRAAARAAAARRAGRAPDQKAQPAAPAAASGGTDE